MVDKDKVLADWASRGFHGGVWIDPPDQVWAGFTHDTDELFMVIDGEVELEMQSNTVRPAPGEEILIPKGVLHSVRNLVFVQPTKSNLQRHERPSARFLLEDGEVPRLVQGLEILSYEEGWLEEDRHEARIVARKPA